MLRGTSHCLCPPTASAHLRSCQQFLTWAPASSVPMLNSPALTLLCAWCSCSEVSRMPHCIQTMLLGVSYPCPCSPMVLCPVALASFSGLLTHSVLAWGGVCPVIMVGSQRFPCWPSLQPLGARPGGACRAETDFDPPSSLGLSLVSIPLESYTQFSCVVN